MVDKIQSKVFNYGNEKEASWLPPFPDKNNSGCFYWDKETQTFREGRPPNPNPQLGVAPMVITDSMQPTYHEGAGRLVESRQEWDRLDKETGCLTFGSIKEPRKLMDQAVKETKKELKQDRRKASVEALRMVRSNPREIRQKLNKQAEKQAEVAKKSGLTKLIKDSGVNI